jgi:hypothetical protein
MLKIERKSRSETSVSLKESGRMLTPTFLLAFGIALAMHLIGITVFHIAPFKLRHSDAIFRPIQVKIDFVASIDSGVLAELENEGPARPPIPEPSKATPHIQAMPPITVVRNVAHPRVKSVTHFPFNARSFESYADNFINIDLPAPNKGEPIKIRIAGDLANKPYALIGIDKNSLQLKDMHGDGSKKRGVSYHVKVENRTGKIFWSHALESVERKKLVHLAEKILASMQFEKSSQGFSSEGDIEIEFLLGNREVKL